MSQQPKQVQTRLQKGQFSLFNNNNNVQFCSVINSSFSQLVEQNMISNKQAVQKVLKKVSQMIISMHSNLIPKAQKLQIYRDLSQQEHQLLQRIKNDPLTHTIYAGVLAVESCLKEIAKQENIVVGRLMKGVTVMLGNAHKLEGEINQCYLTENKNHIEQSMLKLWDSMNLVLNDLHRLPSVKPKSTQIDRHNELISNLQVMNNDMLMNRLSRQQNLLFSLLVQQNNLQRHKISELEKKLTQVDRLRQVDKQKHELAVKQQQMSNHNKASTYIEDINKSKLFHSPVTSEGNDPNPNNDTASESRNTHDSLLIIKQLNRQLIQKEEIIRNMNLQFTIEIQKYGKIFQKLENDNQMLKKIVDVEMPKVIESLEYEIKTLKDEKRQYQIKFSQLVSQVNNMACIGNQPVNNFYEDNNIHNQIFSTRPRANTRINPNIQPQRAYQPLMKRSQCPSVSPSNKQQIQINRYFSPTYQPSSIKAKNYPHQQYGHQPKISERKHSNGGNLIERPRQRYKRNKSPTFGNPLIQGQQYMNKNQVIQTNTNYGQRQFPVVPNSYFTHNMQRSNSKKNPMKGSQMFQNKDYEQNKYPNENQNEYDLFGLKKEMRRSKYINEDIVYL